MQYSNLVKQYSRNNILSIYRVVGAVLHFHNCDAFVLAYVLLLYRTVCVRDPGPLRGLCEAAVKSVIALLGCTVPSGRVASSSSCRETTRRCERVIVPAHSQKHPLIGCASSHHPISLWHFRATRVTITSDDGLPLAPLSLSLFLLLLHSMRTHTYTHTHTCTYSHSL